MGVSAPTDKRFRRVHVTPRSRRRLRRSPTRLIVAALAGTCLFYAAYRLIETGLSSDALTVRRITVTGNSRLSQGEVLALVDGLRGRNMLLLDLDEWRQKLLASPWVADAALRRVLPGTVDVVVSERRPIGIARLDGALYLVDERGHVIDEFGPHHADLDLPLIDGLAAAGPARGSEDPAVDESRTALVRVGDDDFVGRLRSYVDLAPALRERVPQIDYVDLRFGERVYVRPH